MAALLEVRNLEIDFPASGGGVVRAVRDVSFTIPQGRSLGLVGESGSGKSVTSLAILRLLPPAARVRGTIVFDGEDLLALDAERMRGFRGARIAMIFQEPMTALNPVMRVGDQIAEAVLAHKRLPNHEAGAAAIGAMREVGIPEAERRARDYPHQFSGGQRQRIMIAMALVNRPQLLIADEPTTALDVTVQAQVLELLAELREKFSLSMLFISHDLAVVSHVADTIAVMYAGQIVEMAPSREIFGRPAHPYTRGLLGAVPSLASDRDLPLRAVDKRQLPPEGLPLIEVAPGHLARVP